MMENTSYIELSRKAVQNNFDYLREIIGDKATISHVVKGNAYGHGINTYVPLAVELGAKHFSTFDAHEAHQVYNAVNGDATLMVMGMIDNEELEWAIEHQIEFFVFDIDRLKKAISTARKMKTQARVHIELETGMNRTGFEKDQMAEVMKIIKANAEVLFIKGICTHYAGAESYANFFRVKDQFQRFKKGVKRLEKNNIQAEALHAACSAAAVRFPKSRLDMVRIGIMQYGFWPSTETYIEKVKPTQILGEDPLQRVISWKSRVMNIKHVKQGEYVGYGTSYLATSDIKVATVPVGYGHGFSRSLSNTGRALVREVRVPVIGTVNMNMMLLDVSQVNNTEKGDEVVLIGNQGEMSISVSSFSDYSDQLNYELLTRLPHDIPRYIVE
ncbi:alanine racemase [Owenweeksia hongkongensis]|uniref:alanine racemase n=1 Tax=Owenweeksia hongkongensis TaxID=253245 RepID=UPI003A919462